MTRLLLFLVLFMGAACSEPPDPKKQAHFAQQSAIAILSMEKWRVEWVTCDGTKPDDKNMYLCDVWAQPPGAMGHPSGLDAFNFQIRCTANDGGLNTCEVKFPDYKLQ